VAPSADGAATAVEGERRESPADALQAALAEMRSSTAQIIAGLRLSGAAAFLVLSAVLGLLLGLPAWRALLPLQALYVAIAGMLLAALRTDSLRRHVSAAVPVVDVLTVFWLQSDNLSASAFSAGVAGWSLGPFVLLVMLASLTLRPRLIYATALMAWACEAALQRQAGISAGSIAASGLVLILAAAGVHWATARIEALLARQVAEQVRARLETERSEELLQAQAVAAQATQQLEEKHRSLLAAQRQAEVLSSLLVHDMKGPLSTVLMRLDMAQRQLAGDPAMVKLGKDLRIASVQGQRLRAMIEDLIAIARLERGALRPHRAEVELQPLLASVVASYEGLAETFGAKLSVAVPEGLRFPLDRELIERVLDNLVSNALRFLRSGNRAQLSAALEAGRLVLAVRNDGPPLPPEMRPRLFERFSGRDERARGNAGLGLYFCKLVALAHGGAIALEEAPGFNVSFVLRLPPA
jgi:signal transduction histidine kinase